MGADRKLYWKTDKEKMRIKKSYHSLLSGFGTERDDPIDRKKRSKDKMRPVLAFLNHLQGSSQICHVRYLEDLRGLGASYRDGARWNEPGFPIVHFAETPSVAMLEMAHYLPSPRLVPPGYRLGVYEVSDEVALERWHVHDLPEGWDRYPHPRSTRRMGTLWLMRKERPCWPYRAWWCPVAWKVSCWPTRTSSTREQSG